MGHNTRKLRGYRPVKEHWSVRAALKEQQRAVFEAWHALSSASEPPQERQMGYTSRVHASSEANYELLPEDTIAVIRLDRYEGPFESSIVNKNGKPANPYLKLFFTVTEGEDEGFTFSDTCSTYVGSDDTQKTRGLWLAFMNWTGDQLEEQGELDWDTLVGKKCKALIGIRKSSQGGEFNKVKSYMRLDPRRSRMTQNQAIGAAPKRTPQEILDDTPF